MAEGLSMVAGDGENSYAANSLVQRKGMVKAKAELQKAVRAMVSNSKSSKIVVADMGCSSGPNSLLAILDILNAINECYSSCKTQREVYFLLNDLPGSDFNNLFRLLAPFRKKMTGDDNSRHLFIYGAPGSFYERIFPDEAVHFVHSSYSLHYLSQVPTEIRNALTNKCIYISKSTPPIVVKRYKEQYRTDFSLFLRLRAKELILGGYMSLLFAGRSKEDPRDECLYLYNAMEDVLNDIVIEGFFELTDFKQLYIPILFAFS